MAKTSKREFSKKVKAPLNEQSKEVCLLGFFYEVGHILLETDLELVSG